MPPASAAAVSAGAGAKIGGSLDANRCVKCGKVAYAAEKMLGTSRTYHKLCFKCTGCNKTLPNASAGFDRDGSVFCKACYK